MYLSEAADHTHAAQPSCEHTHSAQLKLLDLQIDKVMQYYW
jgi:ABC-type nickel/cobalt efflux system permease component RcnA